MMPNPNKLLCLFSRSHDLKIWKDVCLWLMPLICMTWNLHFPRSACDPYLFLDVAEGVSNVAFTGQAGFLRLQTPWAFQQGRFRNHCFFLIFFRRKRKKNNIQVIQSNLLYPLVGGHLHPFCKGHLTIPNKVTAWITWIHNYHVIFGRFFHLKDLDLNELGGLITWSPASWVVSLLSALWRGLAQKCFFFLDSPPTYLVESTPT